MIIDVDILIAVSLLTNGSIFYLAGKLAGQRMSAWRLIVADILALLLTLGLLTPYGIYLTQPSAKIFSAVVLAWTAYPWHGRRFYFRQLILMLLTASMVSSLCLLVHSLSGALPVTAGILKADERPTLLNLLTALGVLAFFTYYHRRINELPLKNVFYEAELCLAGKRVRLRALADTGNRLLTAEGKGVMLGYYQSMAELLPEELYTALEHTPPLRADQIILAVGETEYAPKMQLISYYTIDRHSFLAAVRLDKAVIYREGRFIREIAEPVLAFAPQRVGDKYELIIPFQMVK